MVGGIRPSAGVVLPHLPPALLHYTINRRKLQAVRQKICAKKVKMLGGVPCAAPARPAAVENSMGGLPRRCRRGGRQRYPAGGLPGWSPAYPAFSLPSCPLSPNPLPRRGRGRPRLFHARGFAPCIPAPAPEAARAEPAVQVSVGRLAFFAACNAFLPPSPQPPSRREGGDFYFISPGATSPGTLALNRLRHLQSLPSRCHAQRGARGSPQKRQKLFPMSNAGSQGEGGPGERNFGV